MARVKAAAVPLSPVPCSHKPATSDAATPRVVAIVLLLWFLAVAAVGHAGLLVGSTFPVIGGYVVATTVLLCVLGLTIPPLRVWLCGLPLRLLVLMNVMRLIGVSFLVSSAAPGGLPDTFAQRAGYGDIFAGITALVLAVGEGEAKLIALRLGKPPAGFGRWSLQLLADQLVALEVVDSISHETVRKTLKKTA
jgi:hypothetical protein